MKSIFTYLTTAICFVAVILTASSCGGSESTSSNTISFWHFYSEPSQKQALKELIADFEKENKCTVELTELSWNDGKTKLMAAFNAGTAPDVLELGSDWILQFASANVLAPCTFEKNASSKFVDFALPSATWNNTLYALPWTVDTRALYVNKSLLEQAGVTTVPQTMDELVKAANAVQSLGNGNYGWGANGSDEHRLYKKILPFMWSNGGDILKDGTVHFATPENVAALDAYVALSREGMIETQKMLDAAFSQGKVAFWYTGGWLADKIGRENSLLNYEVIPFPSMKTGTPGVSFAGGEYVAISAASNKKELAQKLAQFLSSGKNSLEFCKKVTEAGFPADKQFYNDSYFLAHPIRSTFAKQLANAKMTPVHPKWLELESILENAVVEALYGNKTAQEALEAAQGQAQEKLASK